MLHAKYMRCLSLFPFTYGAANFIDLVRWILKHVTGWQQGVEINGLTVCSKHMFQQNVSRFSILQILISNIQYAYKKRYKKSTA